MLDKLMQTSLQNRLIVLLIALGVFVTGVIVTLDLPIDVFPDLTAPTVTIMTGERTKSCLAPPSGVVFSSP